MNSKLIYRIELASWNKQDIAEEITLLAALSNGGKYRSLKELSEHAKIEAMKYPGLNSDVSINIIGDNVLTIDKGTKSLLILTEVEIMELKQPEISPDEARSILREDIDEQLN